MIKPDQVTQLKDLLEVSQTIFIIFLPTATADQMAMAQALYHSLAAVQKEVKLLTPQVVDAPILESLREQIQTEMGNQNLLISLNYSDTAVDKVSYHIGEESGKFYLTIKPKKGHKPLDATSVEIGYAGAEADLLFLVGVNQLESLEQLYFGYEDLYRNSPVVTINTFEPEFGLVKLDTSGSASQSEVLARLIMDMGLQVDPDNATHLLMGIEAATDGFRSMSASAETFEMVAELMRRGARRVRQQQLEPMRVLRPTMTEMLVETDMPTSTAIEPEKAKKIKKAKSASSSAVTAESKPGSLKYQPKSAGLS